PAVNPFLAEVRLLGTESAVVDYLEGFFEHGRIVTAIQYQRRAVAVEEASVEWHLLGTDQVATTEIGGVHPQALCHRVDGAVHGKRRLRPASPAVRSRWDLVGHRGAAFDPDV